ncbi:Ribonuclease H [Salmonella phage SPFM12]|nr:Ribonuclease H [Salmonella phage SPFM12]
MWTEINRIKEPEGRYYIAVCRPPMGKRPVSVILTRGIDIPSRKPVKEYYRSVDKSITLKIDFHQEKGYVLNDITDLLFDDKGLSYRALDIRDELATTLRDVLDSNVWFFEDLAISRMLRPPLKFVDVAGDGLPADKMHFSGEPKMRQYDPIGVVNNEFVKRKPWDNIYTIVNNHAALAWKDTLVFIGKMIPDAHFSVMFTKQVKDETFYYMFGGNHAKNKDDPICTVKYCYPLVNEDHPTVKLPASAEPEPIAAGMNLAAYPSAVTATNDGVPYQPYWSKDEIKGHSGHYGNDRADELARKGRIWEIKQQMKKEGRGVKVIKHKRGWVRADGTPLANKELIVIIYVDASYVVNTFNEWIDGWGELIAFITLFENAPFRAKNYDTVQFVDAVIPVPKEFYSDVRITTVGYKKVPQDVKCPELPLFNNGDLEDSQAYSHPGVSEYTDGSHTESPKGSGAGIHGY